MTPGLLRSVRRKQELYIITKKHPNNLSLISYYTKYKNNFTKILRGVKIKFYKKKFADASFSPTLTWKIIKEILEKKKTLNDEI